MLGVVFHWLGGLAAGSFYVPYRAVKKWPWEVYWIVGGFFSWIVMPWILASINTNDLLAVLREAPWSSIKWAYFWGAMWGLGGLTFGLTMRYLGMSLGMAVALGYCAAFGALIPPIYHREFVSKLLEVRSGWVILGGVAVCLFGIAIAGMAGMFKEKEMTEEQKKATIKEFSFVKGILVATFSGVMSACFAFGLDAATPIAEISLKHGTRDIWTGLPKLCVVLLGGFTTNFIWCALLNIKNRTGYQYFSPTLTNTNERVPMLWNYFFSALAGVTWYMQFFFYTMGESQMGQYKFSSWPIHMASIIIFSSLWGIALREWKGTSRKTRVTLSLGLLVLIGSTVIIGYGNYLATLPAK
jgi:L-rhamnose-H+ transport protein